MRCGALRPIVSVGICAALFLSVDSRAADSTAAELAQALQHRYAAVRDFSADFVHETQSGVLKKRMTERGTLLVKKPGKMRWEYTAPEKKLFVSDGVKTFLYVPADRQVFIGTLPPDDTATTPILFLAGKGDLTRDFTSALSDPSAGLPQGTRALKLTPKTSQPEYEWLTLAVEPGTLQLRALAMMDAQGGLSTFTFTNLKENAGLSDQSFVFKLQSGIDVVTDTSRP